MRLDFNVLWVEDQPSSVEAYAEKIRRELRKQGFKLQAEFAVSVEQAKGFLSSDIYGDHIDLVLMDYDLGVAPMGDEGLLAVREVFAYKDIVFYSADVAGLLKKVADRRIEGVFCSTRDDLPDTVVGVFDALVKKVVDIDHSRGIVMGTTSDIDYFINECLLSAFESGDDETRKKALAIIKKRLKEIREKFEEDAAKVGAATHVSELSELHQIYTSSDRLRLLRNMLNAGGKYPDQCSVMKAYMTDTVPKRNILAHVRVQRDGFRRKLINKKDGKELTVDEMRTLRLALLESHEMFEELWGLLSDV
jgi:hypothetical protein